MALTEASPRRTMPIAAMSNRAGSEVLPMLRTVITPDIQLWEAHAERNPIPALLPTPAALENASVREHLPLRVGGLEDQAASAEALVGDVKRLNL